MGLIDDIERDGFAGPFPILSPKECARLLPRLAKERHKKKVWSKASAVNNHHYYTIASEPRILKLVRPILGEDIILWAAHLVVRRPDTEHPFTAISNRPRRMAASSLSGWVSRTQPRRQV